MIPTVYFTNGIPVCPGGFPCLSPVLRWRPLRAVHSSSKLLFACRHLKSITLTNLHSREHCYHWLHTEACWSSTSQVRSELGEFVYVCVYKGSKREELQHQVQWSPRQHTTHPHIHNDERVHVKLTHTSLSSCCQSHCVSGQLLSEWKTVARESWRIKRK